jgi:hypothetical protein
MSFFIFSRLSAEEVISCSTEPSSFSWGTGVWAIACGTTRLSAADATKIVPLSFRKIAIVVFLRAALVQNAAQIR